ncbi:RagB/SusD family nutrient uptake outer membrane protein [Membranihabitans marinus]|uniref:RagB/SusD family nutrient uptake outer membrane protein n=1 Tax=Membranihabitans marinus TaxID=1227546 RepID=UPI001F3DD526|nr:RagB/SusD family nutrient uptake outer membrane protein [Membranihabitans marinus]
MKQLILYIIFGIFFFTSCSEDFLKLSPETNLTTPNFFKTESHFDLALVGAYQQLRGIVVPGLYMDEMRSDNTFFRYYAPDRGPANWVEDIIEWIDQSQTTIVNTRYYNNYSGISRVNTIIAKVNDADISNEAKDRVLGEALFLRAFYYFDLVTHYGGVPLYLEDVLDEAGAYITRSDESAVYNQIIVDLEKAIPLLPTVTVFPQSGRATKGAAKMLLGKTFMSKPNREYDKAEKQLLDIVNMNYSLLDNYADCFDPQNKNNSESIFEIQYKEGNDGQQSNFIYSMLPKTSDTKLLTGVSANNVTAGGWNVPNLGLIESYEDGDLRLKSSVKIIEGTLNGGDPYSDPVIYLNILEIGEYDEDPDKVYFPFVAKFVHGPYSLPNNTGENWPVFRYSDVLLLLSECLVEQGKNNESLQYINKVRDRAGLSNLTSVSLGDVLKERRHELAFENHRMTDLIRTGKAIEVMTAYGNRMKEENSFLPQNAFDIKEYRLVYPIPFRETQINVDIIQNPGY